MTKTWTFEIPVIWEPLPEYTTSILGMRILQANSMNRDPYCPFCGVSYVWRCIHMVWTFIGPIFVEH